jgi:hypothetical protein
VCDSGCWGQQTERFPRHLKRATHLAFATAGSAIRVARALLDLLADCRRRRVLIGWPEASGAVAVSRRKQLEFPPGTLDVRGWQAIAELDAELIGTIEDLLVDGLGRPLYFEVLLGSTARHVLVPLSRVHADPSGHVIWVEGMSLNQFERVPEYTLDPATLTPAYELQLVECYEGLSFEGVMKGNHFPTP